MIKNNISSIIDTALSEIIKSCEGLHDLRDDNLVYAYHDPVGYPTIGFGHLLSKIIFEDLAKYRAITITEAEILLNNEMAKYIKLAFYYSPVLLKQDNVFRLIAITDFLFNVGEGNYKISTLKKKVDLELWEEAAYQIKRWDKANGKKLLGLTKRRELEAVLLLKDYN